MTEHPIPLSVLTAYDRKAAHTEIDGAAIELAMEFDLLCNYYDLSPEVSRTELLSAIHASSDCQPSVSQQNLDVMQVLDLPNATNTRRSLDL